MMNIRQLGSQESIGRKKVDNICAQFCLKLWNFLVLFKATGIFVILLSRDRFKCNLETKFQQSLRKASLEAAVQRCSSK